MATNKLKKKIGKGRHASTIKRAKQNKVRQARNKQALSRMKTVIKNVRASKSVDDLKKAIPLIAKAAKRK
jgi:Ribosomal protein S20.